MADNIENNYNTRDTGSRSSSATGWVIGVIIAVVAIAALWYYGTRGDVDTAGTNTNNNVTTVQPDVAPDDGTVAVTPPATTTENAPAVGSDATDATGTTTTPPAAGTDATAPPTPATDTTAPAAGSDTTTTPAPAPAPVNP